MYISKSISNFEILDEISLIKRCNCSNCQFESMFINFEYGGNNYVIAGVYRHPKGNTSHFTSALEEALDKCESKRTIFYCADSNIDLIKFDTSHVEIFVNMMLSRRFLPHITLPTRITESSATCIDHIFIRHPTNNVSPHTVHSI